MGYSKPSFSVSVSQSVLFPTPSLFGFCPDFELRQNYRESCLTMDYGGSRSPPIGLGLALGRSDGSTDHHHHHNRAIPATTGYRDSPAYGFTVLQLEELQLQSLIFKYIEAGCPVPYYLLLPLWRSISSPLSNLKSTLYQLCPSYRGLELANGKGMEAEAGRCRRTDGKKWRCSKEALPDQKYCQRHMHRGRQRSRKLVEALSLSQTATPTTDLSISLPFTTATAGFPSGK